MRRRGFTLLEVMVAIVLTSVVALTAYGAARVSAETGTRLDAGLHRLQGERALRQTLTDLLHNARVPLRRGDTAFVLGGDTLTFAAAGVPPLDPDYDWRITLRPGATGPELAAATIGRAPRADVAFRVPGVTRYEIRVLAPAASEWRRDWPPGPVLPGAVAITFWRGTEPLHPPLHMTLPRRTAAGSTEPATTDE